VQSFKPKIDETQWHICKTTHTITGSGGFTTSIELETEASVAAGAVVED